MSRQSFLLAYFDPLPVELAGDGGLAQIAGTPNSSDCTAVMSASIAFGELTKNEAAPEAAAARQYRHKKNLDSNLAKATKK